MILIYQHETHIPKIYPSAKNEVSRQGFQKLEQEQDRQTHRQTDKSKHITIAGFVGLAKPRMSCHCPLSGASLWSSNALTLNLTLAEATRLQDIASMFHAVPVFTDNIWYCLATETTAFKILS